MLQDTGGLSVEMLIKHGCEVAAFSTEGRDKKTCFLLSRHSWQSMSRNVGRFISRTTTALSHRTVSAFAEREVSFLRRTPVFETFFFLHYLERNIGLASLKTPLPSFLLWGLGIQLHLTPTSQWFFLSSYNTLKILQSPSTRIAPRHVTRLHRIAPKEKPIYEPDVTDVVVFSEFGQPKQLICELQPVYCKTVRNSKAFWYFIYLLLEIHYVKKNWFCYLGFFFQNMWNCNV